MALEVTMMEKEAAVDATSEWRGRGSGVGNPLGWSIPASTKLPLCFFQVEPCVGYGAVRYLTLGLKVKNQCHETLWLSSGERRRSEVSAAGWLVD